MTFKEFKDKAHVVDFNNCNGWGFGGSFGKYYELDGFTYRSSKYSTRHSGTYKNDAYYIPTDSGNQEEVSQKTFIHLIDKLT